VWMHLNNRQGVWSAVDTSGVPSLGWIGRARPRSAPAMPPAAGRKAQQRCDQRQMKSEACVALVFSYNVQTVVTADPRYVLTHDLARGLTAGDTEKDARARE